LRAIDPQVELLDAVEGYYDREERPLLVDAVLRSEGHPLRFCVGIALDSANSHRGSCTLSALVRRSTPEFELDPSLTASLLALVRLRRDVKVGDGDVDGAWVVSGSAKELERVFTPEARVLLRDLAPHRPVVRSANGVASADWRYTARSVATGSGQRRLRVDSDPLILAARVLTGLRRLPPRRLLDHMALDATGSSANTSTSTPGL
jgi:hypothetical protein